ncbi:hypothetical protein [Paenibacillus riograndensis]|uniref:hypothetical protein n=1 Tax=Paenibacillus riograndensis TaxID=483937 RepID=UPI00118735D3|nr:hypothetical protein [Paenibacillus riograndensis]
MKLKTKVTTLLFTVLMSLSLGSSVFAQSSTENQSASTAAKAGCNGEFGGRGFTSGFLQIPPRDDILAFS